MRTGRITVAAAGVALLALTACSGSSKSGGTGGGGGATTGGKVVSGKTFTMAIASDPGNLDPQMTVLSITRGVDRFLYSRLIGLDSSGGGTPALAEKWSATTTTATFTLKDGITCADGTPLTAQDVAQNISFVGDAKNKSPLLGVVVMPGTTATGDNATHTVSVKSGAPDAFLLRNVGTLPIVCPKGLTDRSILAKGGAPTGLYAMSEDVPNDHYTLTLRKGVTWGEGGTTSDTAGLPAKVVIKVIQNESTEANLLLSGGLNAATVEGPDQQRLLAKNLFHSDLEAPEGELWYNEAPGRPGSDPAVRKALTQALNLAEIGKVLTNGKGKPSHGMITLQPAPCTGDPVSGNVPGFDLSAAKSALDAAGWRAGAGGVRSKDGKKLQLTVIYGTQLGPTMVSGAELLQQTWKQLGVDVTLKGVDSPGLNTVLFSTGAWDASMAPVGLNLPSQLVSFVSGPVPPNGTNFAHIDNATYNATVKKASSQSGTSGCADWNAAESALVKNVDVVPYVNSVIPTFGAGAKFTVDADGLSPYTIRMSG
jgi:peptide/nickel transport system substrate-binding protein